MEWEDFERKLLAKAGPIQRQECRRAFYAGCQTTLFLLVTQLGSEDEPMEEDMRYVDLLKTELEDFYKQVILGKA